jgi:hypothetical protein
MAAGSRSPRFEIERSTRSKTTQFREKVPFRGAGQVGDAPHAQERGRQEESMILALYIAAAVIMAVGSLYFAWQNRNFRKFLAGAFFVSSGILFYLYLADVSVPLLGTGFVETPEISAGRSIVHFILFVLCFYFGFVRRPKA